MSHATPFLTEIAEIARCIPRVVSVFAGRIADTGRDPLTMFYKNATAKDVIPLIPRRAAS